MSFNSEIEYLLDYTEWDRGLWEPWFRTQGSGALAVGLGDNADGRIANIGELVRHIFSAEQRYVERVRELALTDTSKVPPTDVDALFGFGRESRARLRQLLHDFPRERWDVAREIQIGPHTRTVTPKTLIIQSVTHEIRHWAQIATLLRIAGRKTVPHDYLLSGLG
jgi:uncharacterized damage-inducible protein DinB